MSDQALLAGRIEVYLSELDRVYARTSLICSKAVASGDDAYWDGVALNLHGYYNGVERIFEDIARTVDSSIPTGSDWHQSLLIQMGSGIAGFRPPVISNELRNMLDEFRGFRHVVRNVYAFNFRPSRLKELVDNLGVCHKTIHHELADFCQFLNSFN